MITDKNGNAVWQWGQDEPFGNTIPNQDPNGTGNQFVFNLGFSGQYHDIETGTYYNGFRDCYDPATGRYCQSDPLGLFGGGFSTYAYGGGNPITRNDPLGLYYVYQNNFGGPPSASQMADYDAAVAYLRQDPGMRAIIDQLEKSPDPTVVRFNDKDNDSYDDYGVNWDPHSATCIQDNNVLRLATKVSRFCASVVRQNAAAVRDHIAFDDAALHNKSEKQCHRICSSHAD